MYRSFLFAALTLVPLAGLADTPGSGELLARMAASNPGLHSYTATVHAHVELKTFPFLGADVTGTLYYKAPDATKVVFTGGVPLVAEQFDKLYAHIPSPSQWRQVYGVDVLSDDGTTTAFKLVPIKAGNVARVDVKVNDRNATIDSMRWTYVNGGFAEMDNHYGSVEGNTLATSQTGHVQEPGYTADIRSTLDNYKINATIPDDTFNT